MEKNINCMEVARVDGEIKRLDNLRAVYQSKIDEIVKKQASAFALKNEIIQRGYCMPIISEIKDPASGVVIGREYKHALNCRHKGDKLEVSK